MFRAGPSPCLSLHHLLSQEHPYHVALIHRPGSVLTVSAVISPQCFEDQKQLSSSFYS